MITLDDLASGAALEAIDRESLSLHVRTRVGRLPKPTRCHVCGKRRVAFSMEVIAIREGQSEPATVVGRPTCAVCSGIR